MDLNKLKAKIENLLNQVNGNLEEVRKTKVEIAQMKKDIYSRIDQGRYIRDDKRIVLSAPEIIIGDVDAQGMLIGNGTHVVIRGNDIRLDGVGTNGKVSTQATQIKNTAVDPGIDGHEAVVQLGSCIINTAGAISLDSQLTNIDPRYKGTLIESGIKTPPRGTILIHGDKEVKIDASSEGTKFRDVYNNALTDVKANADNTKNLVNFYAANLKNNLKDMKKILKNQDTLQELSIYEMRFSLGEIDADNIKYLSVLNSTYSNMEKYYRYVSTLEEYRRQISCLEKAKDKLPTPDDYKTKTTAAQVIINGECVSVTTNDADGNKRTNKEAGIYLNANNIDLNSYQDPKDKSMTMMPYSSINIASKNINIHTSDISGYEVTDTTVKGTYNPTGNVNINSKHVNIESMKKDIAKTYAADQGNTKVTLTETVKDYPTAAEGGGQNQEGGGQNNQEDKGVLLLKGNNIQLAAVDKDEKADGKIELNALNTEITAIDKKNKQDEAIKQNSKIVLYSDEIYNGYYKDTEENLSSHVYFNTKQVTMKAMNAITLYEDSNKGGNGIILFEGRTEIYSGEGVNIYGKTKVDQSSTFNSDVTINGKLTTNAFESKTAFKTQYQKEGSGGSNNKEYNADEHKQEKIPSAVGTNNNK